MATYTSSQSGNFSSSATWGGAGVPGDADVFNVLAAHTVTIDSGITVPTNGYADSYVYGILQSESGTSNTLRMNGRLYIKSGGTLHLRDGAKIQIKGTFGDQHGIWQEDENAVSVIMEGSDGMPTTTTTAALSIGDESLPVSSASAFAVGEWISIFDISDFVDTSETNMDAFSDEGFWVHDVSGNNIYFRLFVSPEETITKASGNTITVTNAKVYRVGQKIIFNTGSDRNVRTITDINYNNNKITLNSNVTNPNNQDGETVYLTSTEKPHSSGSKVRKMATVTTSESASSATTITIADATQFSVGDEIYIERRSEADSNTDYAGWWNSNRKEMRYTISSISGNTLTLSSALEYRVVATSLVTRLSREVVCETLDANGADHGFFYCEYTSNWNSKLILKDVYFRNWGATGSNNYTGVVFRGLMSTDSLSVALTESVPSRPRECWIEGLSIYIVPDSTHGGNNDWGPLWMFDSRAKIRNCIAIHGDEGISAYYEPHVAIYNCISTGMDGFGLRWEGSSGIHECAYNYVSRCTYGIRCYTPYELGMGVHDHIADANLYAINMVTMSHQENAIYRSKFIGIRQGINNEHSGGGTLYCSIKSLSGLPQPENDATTRGSSQEGQFRQSNFYYGTGFTHHSTEHNFEIDQFRFYGYRWEAFWDNDEKAWRFFCRYDASSYPGLLDQIYVPAEATLRLSAKVKLDPAFSGTYPYLGIVDNIMSPYSDQWGTGQGSHRLSGNRITTQYSASAASAYEEKQLTLSPVNYPRFIMAGVFAASSNASEGFWIKDINAMLDEAYQSTAYHNVNRMNSGRFVQVRNNFNQPKTRLGGRLR